MKRICVKYDTQYIKQIHPHLENSKVEVYIDAQNSTAIEKVIASNKKKFDTALTIVLSGGHNKDNYGKEKMSEKSKDMTAIKFKKGLNIRLYCKEISKGNKKVVIIEAILKKSQKPTTQLTNRINVLGGYDYEFID